MHQRLSLIAVIAMTAGAAAAQEPPRGGGPGGPPSPGLAIYFIHKRRVAGVLLLLAGITVTGLLYWAV